jgi:hypothetical protein
MLRSLIVTFAAIGLAACSPASESGEERCLAITREYQSAMPDALICDPGVVDACGAGRPVIVSEQAPDGTVTLRGLCMAPCLAAVNPTRTAALDQILARFHAQGCTLGACWCPRPESMPPTCMENGGCWGLGPE